MCSLENELNFLLQLLDTKLSKSEIKIIFYCKDKEMTSKDIAKIVGWEMPNVSRILKSMHIKGLLSRKLLDDKRAYLYTVNKENSVFKEFNL